MNMLQESEKSKYNLSNEQALRNEIEKFLTEEDEWRKENFSRFNRISALIEDTFIKFIVLTQKEQWQKHCKNHPEDPYFAIIKTFQNEVNKKNLLYVLRHGFKDRDVKFYPCFFKPENALNETADKKYKQNIFNYVNDANDNIILFLNGIPIVSIEVKNKFEKNNTKGIIEQYKFNRNSDEKIFEFKKRVLVHFALDLYEVYMTTKLEGKYTKFLPFNQGSNGAGKVGGSGNPLNNTGFITSYFWEQVLVKDSLMEILQKYMHLQSVDIKDKDENIIKTKEIMIFPRYHQLDVVRKILKDVKQKGSGKNYLIQHSAGSGKSNSIAWLAHRLQSLHNQNNEIIFNSVIVVTDRKILDSQLQDTIYQFDHVKGVVKPIKQGSLSLKKALEDGIKIIVTTLQKFPYIYKDIKSTGKKYAVIVDEAHSSQTGVSAKKLKSALADVVDDNNIENDYDYEDKLIKEILTHGNHKNISFFAFTATPKNKTLQMFGEKQQDGSYKAFHIYSMRQAIEEGFILDVLQNYTTYTQFYKIIKKVDKNIEFNNYKKAILKFESLHPDNISQKTQIMLEHFKNITKHKINGKAKAMLVTSSRLHAVRYFFEFKRYIKEHNYNDINVLVAFSGKIKDNGEEYSEEKLNKNKKGETIKENQLKEYFKNEFDILIVAEKYQTGFDEPLLHTMFVDKKLSGIKAVQTLSRLNRTIEGKEDTFVLDFANTKNEIKHAFQPFYEASILEKEINPDIIYHLKQELEKFNILRTLEIENFAKNFYSGTIQKQISDSIKERYNLLNDKQKYEFKLLLNYFNSSYTFITQITEIFDKDIQKFYVYTKFLEKNLTKKNNLDIDLNDTFFLEYYKIKKTSEGSIKLDSFDKQNNTVKNKYNIIEKSDRLIETLKSEILKDIKILNAVKNGDKTAFNTLYNKKFTDTLIKKYEENNNKQDFFYKELFENTEKFNYLKKFLSANIYKEIFL